MKCIEDEIPFDIPDGWSWCRGYSCFKGMESLKPYGEYFDYIDIDAIDNKSHKVKSAKHILVKEAPSRASRKIENGSVLFSLVRPYLENIAYIDEELSNCIASTGFYVCNSNGVLNSHYMFRLMTSNYVINGLNEFMKGDNSPSIKKEDIENFLFPIPPIQEQICIDREIGIYLKTVDIINDNENNLTASIKSVKSKILDLAIRGKLVPQDPNDEPASVLLERIRAEKEELIKQGKIKRDKKESVIFKGDDNSYYRKIGSNIELIEMATNLPEGWEYTTIGEYAKKVTDQVASGSFASLRENVKSLKSKDYALMVKTADFSNDFTKNLTYTDKHGYEFLENSNLFGGELILSNIGSIGKVFIVPALNCKMTLAPNSIMIRPMKDEHRDYLYYYFMSPIGYESLLSISGGAAVAKFNKTDLKKLVLPLPPLAEQKRIVDAIETLFAQIDKITKQIS